MASSEKKENMLIHSNRETLYRFLGRIYKTEVDRALLDRMMDMRFPVGRRDAELEEGYRLLEQYLGNPGGDPLTDLAVDYARVFLGAGIATYKAAYPYESVYTSKKRIVMQEARDESVAAYLAKGLRKAETLDFPEDHIALELEFMAFMCVEARQAAEAGDKQALGNCCEEQLDFLNRHLLNWTPEFCGDIEKFAATSFYKAIAKITGGYLRMDCAFLEGLYSKKTIPF